ncbi:hypothetical protein AFEL58S_01977 [Afipia felis]
MPVNWTPLEKKIVEKLAREGKSAEQIAQHVSRHGRTASRSAVLGLLWRMGVTSKGCQGAPRRKSPQPRKVEPRAVVTAPAAPVAPVVEAPVKVVCEDVTLVPLLQLKDHHCRWPIGDVGEPGFGFCGCSKIAGSSYCQAHTRRAAPRGALA